MAMEEPTNGGFLYHETQESKLCTVHCLNTLMQGPFFSEVDLATITSELDRAESQVTNREGNEFLGDFFAQNSRNVSVSGDFSIQVIEKALKVWNLQVIPIDSPWVSASKYDPEVENAFVCHSQEHWFCIRKVNGEWYNFDSLFVAPEHLSRLHLSALLDTLRGSGWSIFIVRGDFPLECPVTSCNPFGQWLMPQAATSMTESINEARPQAQLFPDDEVDLVDAFEDYDFNAAIAASLMGSSARSDEDVLSLNSAAADTSEMLGDGKD